MKIACQESTLEIFKCAVKPTSAATCPEMVTGIMKPIICLCDCPMLAKLMPATQMKKEEGIPNGDESAIASEDQLKILDDTCPLTTEAFACVNEKCDAPNMVLKEDSKPSKDCGPPQGLLDDPEGECHMQKTSRMVCTAHKAGCQIRWGPGKCAEDNHLKDAFPECDPVKDWDAIPETCCQSIKKSMDCSIKEDYGGDEKKYKKCMNIMIGNKMSMSKAYDDALYNYITQCKDWGMDVDQVMAVTDPEYDPNYDPNAPAPAAEESAADAKESDFAFSLRGGTVLPLALLVPVLFLAASQ